MLDISVKDINKISKIELHNYLIDGSGIFVEEKYDGVKISLLRNNEDYSTDYTKNWIISYKGNIIYPFECEYWNDNVYITEESIGISQYRIIHRNLDILNQLNMESFKKIPKNTEFFCEFIIRKPTITRKYEKYHNLILIGFRPIRTFKIKNSMIEVESYNDLQFFGREYYSNLLGIKTPRIIDFIEYFDKKSVENYKNKLLEEKSEFGGLVEGFIFRNSSNELLKMVQSDQYSKEVRNSIKDQYRLNKEEEQKYWLKVKEKSLELIEMSKSLEFEEALKNISDIVYNSSNRFNILHQKKTEFQIRDDIYLTSKMRLVKNLLGNNNCLFIGKFRILTNAHYNIIKYCLDKYDNVVVGIVTEKGETINFSKRIKMMSLVFGYTPEIKFININTGNIITAINKCGININTIVCGSDRFESYKKQLENDLFIDVEEIERREEFISATKIFEFLSNKDKTINEITNFYKNNVPKEIFENVKVVDNDIQIV